MTGSTISFAGIIGPGQTLPVALSGTMFYLSVATAPLYLRPSGQVWSQYQPGTGCHTPAEFSLVEVYNGNPNAVTFQLFCGVSDFIDHRILPNLQAPNVVNVLGLPSGAQWTSEGSNIWSLLVPDLSLEGVPFKDVFGSVWLPMSRVFFSVQTAATTATLYVTASYAYLGDLAAAQANAISVIQSVTASGIAPAGTFAVQGSFGLFLADSSGNANASVFEVYSAIKQGFQGTPPS